MDDQTCPDSTNVIIAVASYVRDREVGEKGAPLITLRDNPSQACSRHVTAIPRISSTVRTFTHHITLYHSSDSDQLWIFIYIYSTG